MARATRATAAQYEGIERKDRVDLVDKEPSPMHERMAKYVAFRTGYDPDVKTVQLVRVLLTEFQASPEEAQIRAEAKAERDQPKAEPAASTSKAKADGKAEAKPAGRSRAKASTTAATEKAAPASGGRPRGRGRGKAQAQPADGGTAAQGEQEPF